MKRYLLLALLFVAWASSQCFAQSAPSITISANGVYTDPSGSFEFVYQCGSASLGDEPITFDLKPHKSAFMPLLFEFQSLPFTITKESGEISFKRSVHVDFSPISSDRPIGELAQGCFVTFHTWLVDAKTGEHVAKLDAYMTRSDFGESIHDSNGHIAKFSPEPDMLNKQYKIVTIMDGYPNLFSISKPDFVLSATTNKNSRSLK